MTNCDVTLLGEPNYETILGKFLAHPTNSTLQS